MLQLRTRILAYLLSSPATSPASNLRRLISASAPAVSPDPSSFAVDDYLVSTCGLTRPQGLKSSTKPSHLKSPANQDAVLAFLAGLGLSAADAAALVAKDPNLLCASVDRTLAPVVAGLSGLGLSRSEIARLADKFRKRSIVSKLQYYLGLFGSCDTFFRVLKFGNVLSYSIERVVKPNVEHLRGCGLGDGDIAKLCLSQPRMLTTNLERLQAMVACAEGLGVPRGSRMFRRMLSAVAFISEENITAKVDFLKDTFRWSDAEVGIAVSKAPMLLKLSEDLLQRKSEFLISEVGLEPAYLAHRSALPTYSLEGRLRPRYCVLKFLKENGLIDHERDFFNTVMVSEKVFMERFICPHKEAAPHLAEDYATACRGEVPARFSFT